MVADPIGASTSSSARRTRPPASDMSRRGIGTWRADDIVRPAGAANWGLVKCPYTARNPRLMVRKLGNPTWTYGKDSDGVVHYRGSRMLTRLRLRLRSLQSY